jgi:tetratricopeptide (TPR) repeat protein
VVLQKRLADSYLNIKYYDKGLTAVEGILKANPRDAEAHRIKGQLLLGQKRTAEAITELQLAANNDNNSVATRYALGLAYLQDRKGSQAESAWKDAINKNAGFMPAYTALAKYNLDAGKIDIAIQYAEQALKADPNYDKARLLLGIAYQAKKYYKEAAEQFERYVKLNPKDPAGLYRLGTVCAAQGNAGTAETYFESALREDPSSAEALAGLASLFLRRNLTDKALQCVERQIQLAPSSVKMQELKGQIYARLKKYPEAEQAFRKAISLDKNSLSSYTTLGHLYILQNSYPKAIAEFENIIKVDPKSAPTHVILGKIYDLTSNTQKARVHYQEALKIDNDLVEANNNLAWIIAENAGNLDDALKYAQKARDSMPDSTNVADTLGWVYYKRAAYRSAINLFEECIRKDARNATFHYHLGMSYSKTGDQSKAKQILLTAIKLDPKLSTPDVRAILDK